MPKSPTPEAVEKLIRELDEDSEVYKRIVKALAERRLGDAAGDIPAAIKEVQEDYQAASPVVGDTINALKAGVATSEFKMSSAINRILSIIAILAPVLEGVMNYLEQTNLGGSSFIVTGLAIVLKAIITLNYTRGRVALKEQQLE